MRRITVLLLLVAAFGTASAQDPGTADTVRVQMTAFDVGNQASVNVYLVNDQPLSGIQIPLTYTGDLAVFDSVVFGPRTAGFTGFDIVRSAQDLGGSVQTVTLAVVPLQTGAIAAGNDPIATLYFSRNLVSTLDTSYINATTVVPAGGLLAADNAGQPDGYVPRFVGGAVLVGTSVAEHPDVLPREFELLPNYPNPFNPTTSFSVALPVPSHVAVEIYNLLGQRVVKLFDGQAQAGYLDLKWDGRDSGGRQVGSGVYFYKVETEAFRQVRKMVLLK